ncbi:MAG: transketolase [Anaerolineaceae bacterium]|nr:transketolase [Anaerolineaceae bacterium]
MTSITTSIEELQCIAQRLRAEVLTMVYQAGEGHPGGSLSAADLLAALYFRVLRINPLQPEWPERDRFILSKGHAAPILYAALAERGYFPKEQLKAFRQIDSILQGHPDMHKTPGVDITTGTLGQGLSDGLGMALGGRVLEKDFRVYVLLGDGEMQEGQVWEAIMAAGNWRLDHLTAIVDYNGLQNDGALAHIQPLEPLADKWRAFGWRVLEIDGHDMAQIVSALESIPAAAGQPTVILARTVKGKGVSFMEGVAGWHGKAPNQAQYQQAMAEIGGEHARN